jgi:hypothetical protein
VSFSFLLFSVFWEKERGRELGGEMPDWVQLAQGD